MDYEGDEFGLDDDVGEAGDHEEYYSAQDTIMLIDTSCRMFEPADAAQGSTEGSSRFEAAVAAAHALMKEIVGTSARCNLAVIFYPTQRKQNPSEYDGVYLASPLDIPDVAAIKSMQMSVEAFQRDIGCGSDDAYAAALKFALWTVSDLLTSRNRKSLKTVLAVTAADSPTLGNVSLKDQIKARVQDLVDVGTEFRLLPLSDGCDDGEWRDVFGAAALPADAHGGAAALKTLRYEVVQLGVRRPSVTLPLQLRDDVALPVAVHNLIRPVPALKKTQLHVATNEPLKQDTSYVCADTGALLPEITCKRLKLFDDDHRFPAVVVDTRDVSLLPAVARAGIALLSFKPSSYLKAHHNLRPSQFLFPAERWRNGGGDVHWQLFSALWSAMREQSVLALCRYIRTRASRPVLVALLPAVEQYDADGEQVWPSGFHMYHLPFAEDFRSPEKDVEVCGIERVVADGAMVDAAVAMIGSMTLQVFNVFNILDPAIIRRSQIIEAVALNEDIPPLDPRIDDTLSDLDSIQRVSGDAIAAFKAAASAGGFSDEKPAKAAASRKRPAAAAADGDDLLVVEKVQQLVQQGSVHKATADQLKTYLRHFALKLTGKKAELIERVQQHMGLLNA